VLDFVFIWCCCAAAQGQMHTVKKVYSGNTIKVHDAQARQQRIRYTGTDAPNKGKPFYELCRDANAALVNNREVTLRTDVVEFSPDDKKLCYVYTGELFVNAEIIRRGYALAHILPPNDRYKDLLCSMEKEARDNKRGLWAYEDHSDEPYYIGSKSRKIFHRPSCFHVKSILFDDRVILRTKEDALGGGFTQDWRCCPLFIKPDTKAK
jgi:micrococcal nuclease